MELQFAWTKMRPHAAHNHSVRGQRLLEAARNRVTRPPLVVHSHTPMKVQRNIAPLNQGVSGMVTIATLLFAIAKRTKPLVPHIHTAFGDREIPFAMSSLLVWRRW